MQSSWFVSPAALARARLNQLLSQEDLAKKSGVSVRSIRAYEKREQGVKLDTLRCLAKALACEIRELAAVRPTAGKEAAKKTKAPASTPPDPPVAALAPTPSVLPPRTPLETLVDLERAAGIDSASPESAPGGVEVLTAKRLQDIMTAYALHDGARFSLTGKVDGMRGLPPGEPELLGSRHGIAARFHIVKEIVPGQPVGVTVHTAKAEHTKLLQKNYGTEPITARLRVVLAPGEPADDAGFSCFISRHAYKRPWTFLVEEVEVAAGERGNYKEGR
jgi:transcriptional regulator with XRE-family HTH domain